MPVDFSPLVNSQPNLLRMLDDIQAQKRAEDMQKMTAYQFLRQKQEDERNDKLRGAYVIDESGAFNPKATFANLLQIDPKSAMEFNAAMEKQSQDALKRQQDQETFKLGKAEKVYNLMKQSSGYIMANPTLANATRELTRFGNMTGADISGELETLQQLGDNPEAIKKWAAGHSLTADQLLPKFQNQDIGGAINAISIDPITGKQTVLSTTPKTATISEQIEQKNKPFNIDGTPNIAYQEYSKKAAKAGAPSTVVNVSTDKKYGEIFGTKLAEQDAAAIDAAKSAPDRIQSARRVKELLDKNPITGTGATWRLNAYKALSTAGLVNSDSVKNTEDLVSELSSQTLDAIKTSGLGSGQGFTDKDRQFLQDAKSGRIEINPGTLRRIADLNEKAALRTIEKGNSVIKSLKSNASLGDVGNRLEEIKVPTAGNSGGSKLKKNPDGSFNYGF